MHAQKIRPVSDVLRTRGHPIGMGHAVCPGLNRVEKLETQKYDFSENSNICQSTQDVKLEQIEKNIEKLLEQIKSVNKDIECKHKKIQNLIRVQEDLS